MFVQFLREIPLVEALGLSRANKRIFITTERATYSVSWEFAVLALDGGEYGYQFHLIIYWGCIIFNY